MYYAHKIFSYIYPNIYYIKTNIAPINVHSYTSGVVLRAVLRRTAHPTLSAANKLFDM